MKNTSLGDDRILVYQNDRQGIEKEVIVEKLFVYYQVTTYYQNFLIFTKRRYKSLGTITVPSASVERSFSIVINN